jgi:hypothetical protein
MMIDDASLRARIDADLNAAIEETKRAHADLADAQRSLANAERERHLALLERIIVDLADAIEQVKRVGGSEAADVVASLEKTKATFVEDLRRAKLKLIDRKLF